MTAALTVHERLTPVEDAAPWPDGTPISLGDALDAVQAALGEYVHFASEEQAIAVTLWVAHTHILDLFDTSPRLAIRAPSKQSGKTRLMEVLKELVKDGWHVVGPSAAVLFRKIERDQPTILLDETDRLFEQRAENTADILQVLNTGHGRGTKVPRVVGPKHELQDFEAFAALGLAGIGTDWPDTIMDRAIVINMERKTSAEPVQRLRRGAKRELRTLVPDLVTALAVVTDPYVDDLPDDLSDRAQDGWEPLIAIARAAGAQWERDARNAAIALAAAGADTTAERIEILALRDVRAAFAFDDDPEFMPSKRIHAFMLALPESPWRDGHQPLSLHMLANHMRTFSIRSDRPKRGMPTGYFLADVERHWGRLNTGQELPTPPPTVFETEAPTDA
jgi:hypothetical protein